MSKIVIILVLLSFGSSCQTVFDHFYGDHQKVLDLEKRVIRIENKLKMCPIDDRDNLEFDDDVTER